MTGFNNGWDREGEMADERKTEGRERRKGGGPQPPTYMKRPYTRRVSLTSHAREKRGKRQ